MNITIITLFPESVETMAFGIIGKAIEKGQITIECINPRHFSEDKHKTVDDSPYGGGPGMVMMAEPLAKALKQAKTNNPGSKVVYLSPQGKVLNQALAMQAAKLPGIIFIAGRYEGIDQRVIDLYVDEEWSIGDYVLTGGELAAMVMTDVIARQIPGIVGDFDSVSEDTFYEGLLKHPQYTRPEVFEGNAVPKVLLSGDHQAIKRWRLQQSLGNTWQKRADLLKDKSLSQEELELLNHYKSNETGAKK